MSTQEMNSNIDLGSAPGEDFDPFASDDDLTADSPGDTQTEEAQEEAVAAPDATNPMEAAINQTRRRTKRL